MLIERAEQNGNGFGWKPTDGSGISAAILTKMGRPESNYIKENET